MNPKTKDRFFFIVQGFIKYIAFPFFKKTRTFIYRPFFKSLGNNVHINDGITFKYPSEIEIGDNVKIAQNCFIVGLGGLKIGNDVLIGASAKIVTTTHNTSDLSIPMSKQGLSFKSIVIKNDVWLGFNAIVLCGSIINEGCILGAGTVITGGEINPYSIVVGVPGKVKKSREELL